MSTFRYSKHMEKQLTRKDSVLTTPALTSKHAGKAHWERLILVASEITEQSSKGQKQAVLSNFVLPFYF